MFIVAIHDAVAAPTKGSGNEGLFYRAENHRQTKLPIVPIFSPLHFALCVRWCT